MHHHLSRSSEQGEAARLVTLVESIAPLRFTLAQSLTNAGYRVQAFAHPYDAFASLLGEDAEEPAVGLIARHLPQMSGIKVTQALHQRLPHMRIVVRLAAEDGVLDRLLARLAGASVIVTTPVDIAQLQHLIQHLSSLYEQSQRRKG